MNTKQKKIISQDAGAINRKGDLALFAKAGWTLANVCLFYNQYYDDHEIKQVRRQIYRLFSFANNSYETYMEFCQRILLAADHITRYRNDAFCKNACIWFHPSCEDGYVKTGAMFERLLKKRQKDPAWKKQWRPLAESVLEMSEGHVNEKFEYWINWFEERNAKYELFIFLRAIDYQSFKNVNDEEYN